MHKKGNSNLTNLLFGLLVMIMIVGVVAAILGNVSSGLKKFVKLNFNCFSQDTDEDGTRDVAEDWIGMGDGCPCENIERGIADKLTPFSGTKHKCAVKKSACEDARYKKCLLGESGNEVGVISGRPISKECEGEFGKECGPIKTLDKNTVEIDDSSFPTGYKGRCNKAQQCVPLCEFCPYYYLEPEGKTICGPASSSLPLTSRCLDVSLQQQGRDCSPDTQLCPQNKLCCNNAQVEEQQRRETAQIVDQSYVDCIAKNSKFQPGQVELINPEVAFNCLRPAIYGCVEGANSDPNRCSNLLEAFRAILKNEHYRLVMKQDNNKLLFGVADINDLTGGAIFGKLEYSNLKLCYAQEAIFSDEQAMTCKNVPGQMIYLDGDDIKIDARGAGILRILDPFGVRDPNLLKIRPVRDPLINYLCFVYDKPIQVGLIQTLDCNKVIKDG